MGTLLQYHISMEIVGVSLIIVGTRFLLTESFSITLAILAIDGLVVLIAGFYSYQTVEPAEFKAGNLTWISAFCAGICFTGTILVLFLPGSHAPR